VNPWTAGYFEHEDEGDGWEARLSKVVRGKLMPWREKQTFTFTLDRVRPVTFVQNDGTQIRPCLPGDSFEMDFGSIPEFAQGLVRKEDVSYAYHDRLYEVGYVWAKRFQETRWVPWPLERDECDALLYTMLRCAKYPRGRFKGGMVWSAVRSFGWACGFEPATHLPDPVVMIREIPDVDDAPVMGQEG
jgi:hypothetical protein